MPTENSQNISITGSHNVSFGNIEQNVTQGSSQSTDEDKLQNLMRQLKEALQQIPPERADEAAAVAKSAEIFIQTASEKEQNKTMLEITGEGLKKAAKNISDVLPSVLSIAAQIVEAAFKMAK